MDASSILVLFHKYKLLTPERRSIIYLRLRQSFSISSYTDIYIQFITFNEYLPISIPLKSDILSNCDTHIQIYFLIRSICYARKVHIKDLNAYERFSHHT